MSLYRKFLSVFFILMLHACVQAQTVRTGYDKDSKKTTIETNMLYLLNAPEQFVEVQFTTSFKGEKMVKLPDRITVTVWSVSKKSLYRTGAQLSAIADGERLKLGINDPAVMTGETKNGEDSFYNEGGLGLQVPTPASAKVRNAQGVNGLALEMFVFTIKPDQLDRIGEAKQLEFRLGDTALPVTEGQMNILRDFASRLKPQP
jgi:hypothetical protein